MDDLVRRLATGSHPVESARPEKTAKAFQDCLKRSYVFIRFTDTGTELGVQVDRTRSRVADTDLAAGMGQAHIEGGLTLNDDKIRVVADLDLTTLDGTGHVEPVGDDEYQQMMGKSA